MKRVNLAEARDRLASLVNDAAYGRQRIILQSRGRPKAALIGLEDLAKLETADEGSARQRRSMMLRWLEETEKVLKREPRLKTSAAEVLREEREERDAALAGVRRRKHHRKAARKRAR